MCISDFTTVLDRRIRFEWKKVCCKVSQVYCGEIQSYELSHFSEKPHIEFFQCFRAFTWMYLIKISYKKTSKNFYPKECDTVISEFTMNFKEATARAFYDIWKTSSANISWNTTRLSFMEVLRLQKRLFLIPLTPDVYQKVINT